MKTKHQLTHHRHHRPRLPYHPQSAYLALLFCLLTLLAPVSLSSCSQQTYNNIPRNGYITHFSPSDHKRMPFDSYWDISDNKDWDERVRGEHGKSQPIYIKPITLAHFQNMPSDPAERRALEELRDYFERKLRARMAELDAQKGSFHLMKSPGKNTYEVEIAILSAQPTRLLNNLVSDAAGFVVQGGGLLLSRARDKGSISMGARFYAPNGKLVAEIADFEYGQESLIGMVLVDTKDFRHYAYQRQTIDQWVEEFTKIFSTIHEEKIRKPWFTLNPF